MTTPTAAPAAAIAEATAALHANAFTIRRGCEHCGHTCGEQRTTVHAYAGPFGADWDLQDALDHAATATDIRWRPHPLGHHLQITAPDVDGTPRTIWFDAGDPQ